MAVPAAEVEAPVANGWLEHAASAARGDQYAFRTLYERFGGPVYNLVVRSVRDPQLAEDICQEAWLKVHREIARLREPGAFSTWLYRIAGRLCVDAARRRRAGPVAVELSEERPGAQNNEPEGAALRGERERLTWEALGALPVRQHLALFMREIEERSYKEIAVVLETSESAVETLLFRARRGLAGAFDRLSDARGERCGLARRAMAVLIDGEATPVQQRAVSAHVDDCRPCRNQLGQLRQANALYAGLPLASLPAAFTGGGFPAALGALSAPSGGSPGLGQLAALVTAKTKLAGLALVLSAGVAGTTLIAPNDTIPTRNGAHASASIAAAAREGAPAPSANPPLGLDSIATTESGVVDQIEAALPPASLPDAQKLVENVLDLAALQAEAGLDATVDVTVDDPRQLIDTTLETIDGVTDGLLPTPVAVDDLNLPAVP